MPAGEVLLYCHAETAEPQMCGACLPVYMSLYILNKLTDSDSDFFSVQYV